MATVRQILVFSRWTGFASPPSCAARLEINLRNSKFFATNSLDHHELTIDAARIESLISVISEPAARFDPTVFGLPEDIVRQHYSSEWTDDDPVMRLKIQLEDGSEMTVHSDSQHDYMIPWAISRSPAEPTILTSNYRVGAAIAAILPEDFLNRERLLGNLLRREKLYSPPVEPEPVPPARESAPPAPMRLEVLWEGKGQDAADRVPIVDSFPSGAELNAADDQGQTLLMRAAFPPFKPTQFERLVAAGADPNLPRKDGMTGLMLAAAGWEVTAAKAWIEARADVNAANPRGETALMFATCVPVIVEGLIQAGADVNRVDADGATALLWAVSDYRTREQRKIEVAKLLLSAGANVKIRDKQGRSALTCALEAVARQRVQAEVERELAPEVAEAHQTDFELVTGDDGKQQVVYFPKTDGSQLCSLLRAAGCEE